MIHDAYSQVSMSIIWKLGDQIMVHFTVKLNSLRKKYVSLDEKGTFQQQSERKHVMIYIENGRGIRLYQTIQRSAKNIFFL